MGIHIVENDSGGFCTVTCDKCERYNKDGKKVKPIKIRYESISLEAVLQSLVRDKWIAKTGYVPAGTTNAINGKVVASGRHMSHVCVCPKCQGDYKWGPLFNA